MEDEKCTNGIHRSDDKMGFTSTFSQFQESKWGLRNWLKQIDTKMKKKKKINSCWCWIRKKDSVSHCFLLLILLLDFRFMLWWGRMVLGRAHLLRSVLLCKQVLILTVLVFSGHLNGAFQLKCSIEGKSKFEFDSFDYWVAPTWASKFLLLWIFGCGNTYAKRLKLAWANQILLA